MTRIEQPATITELQLLVGAELGPTRWRKIDQAAVNAFADVTDDHQWIHLDAERAARSPFGTTIAHGLFTLSLGPAMSGELLTFERFAHTLNYGYEKVRFPAPLPVGSRLRLRVVVESVQAIGPGVAHVVIRQIFEREDGIKPVCVANAVGRVTEDTLAGER